MEFAKTQNNQHSHLHRQKGSFNNHKFASQYCNAITRSCQTNASHIDSKRPNACEHSSRMYIEQRTYHTPPRRTATTHGHAYTVLWGSGTITHMSMDGKWESRWVVNGVERTGIAVGTTPNSYNLLRDAQCIERGVFGRLPKIRHRRQSGKDWSYWGSNPGPQRY